MSSTLHPDGKLNPHDSIANSSGNDSILDLIEARQMSRRNFLKGSLGMAALAVAGGGVAGQALAHAKPKALDTALASLHSPSPVGGIGFTSVAPNILPMTDAVTVPAGYTARVLIAWGDPLTKAPMWDPAGAMDEATQLRSFGAHNDGMHFFPFPASNKEAGKGKIGNDRGLLVCNHEYNDPALVNNIAPYAAYATTTLTLDMVRAQQAAHGVSVVEIERKRKGKNAGEWEVKRGSAFNRRITGNTPCKVSGPVAGHALLKTAADPSGTLVLGTLNNCAHGYTPWGTYLTCEENWNGYFGANGAFTPNDHERRYGVSANGFGYRWHTADPRFDLNAEGNRNEPNRFGWVVEIDPFNPNSTPIKRTALGRIKHEGAWVVVGEDNTVAVYMGDDERNEYIYKFVCAKKYNPKNPAANRDLLDAGTLYVAKFKADGSGEWLPLVWGQNGLTPANGFADQAEVLIKCRQAADRVGATMMDRPEWGAAHPVTREVYMTLTNNSRRGNTPVSSNKVDGTSAAASANPPVDKANPRPDNDYGHIIRWREQAGKVQALAFEWDIFAQCGDKQVYSTSKTLGASYNKDNFIGVDPADPLLGKKVYAGNIVGDDYGAPDGLWFDDDGRLWIQTDQAGDAKGDWVNIGGNQMLCADPSTGETRRFLTAPPHCEVTGVVTTPDGKTMFVGIQHPGEDWSVSPTQNSRWPDNGANGPTTASELAAVYKPRSAVVVITKDDGGVIGT
ncbi:MAG: PhoX family protein [Thiobacillus sp.]